MLYAWVALGGALGSMARYGLANWMATLTGPQFPWGTMLINVVGSFVIGWFGALTGRGGMLAVPPEIRVLVLVGVCGGFTTFSSFSMQTFELFQAGEALRAAGYVLGSVALCLGAVAIGVAVGK